MSPILPWNRQLHDNKQTTNGNLSSRQGQNSGLVLSILIASYIYSHAWLGLSGLSTWKYQFSYDHWYQATLRLVSAQLGLLSTWGHKGGQEWNMSSCGWSKHRSVDLPCPQHSGGHQEKKSLGWNRSKQTLFLFLESLDCHWELTLGDLYIGFSSK